MHRVKPILLNQTRIGLFALGLLCTLSAVQGLAQTNRISYAGKDLFLNGINLAWGEYPNENGRPSFADDIGPTTNTPNTNHFADVFSQLHEKGGNAMRLWLHTTGRYTPAWDGSTVTGPGDDTIDDLRTILDLAWDHKIGMMLCLWSFDMLRIRHGAEVTDRATAILTDPTSRGHYVTNSLIPMVEALQGHPGILAWEIFNEPEGMSNEHGWRFNHHVPISDIQAFVNVCAGAIHRTDPVAKVTNGSWAFIASSDVGEGNYNYYSDDRLIAAGGDSDGVLDFYCVHYYDWAGTERSPFQNPVSYWGLDKPVVIAEFHPNCKNCTETSHETLYQNGYAGALSWSWTDSSHQDMLGHIEALATAHPDDVRIETTGAREDRATGSAP